MLRMKFTFHDGLKWYGPIKAKDGDSEFKLTPEQEKCIGHNFRFVGPVLLSEDGCGLWVGSTCTNECKACFGYRTRSIPSGRHIPYVTTRPLCC